MNIDQLTKFKEYDKLLALGLVYASTKRQEKNGTITFKFHDDVIISPHGDIPKDIAFKIMIYHKNDEVKEPVKYTIWTGDRQYVGVVDEDGDASIIKCINKVIKRANQELKGWEKIGSKIFKTAEERQAHRGLIMSRKFGF